MSTQISYDPEHGMVHALHTGAFTAQDMQSMTSHCIGMTRERGCARFLIDLSGIELEASFFDIYNLPERQYATEGAGLHGRIAVLMPAGGREREAAQFYQTASRNRGHLVSLFEGRDAALAWLGQTA